MALQNPNHWTMRIYCNCSTLLLVVKFFTVPKLNCHSYVCIRKKTVQLTLEQLKGWVPCLCAIENLSITLQSALHSTSLVQQPPDCVYCEMRVLLKKFIWWTHAVQAHVVQMSTVYIGLGTI